MTRPASVSCIPTDQLAKAHVPRRKRLSVVEREPGQATVPFRFLGLLHPLVRFQAKGMVARRGEFSVAAGRAEVRDLRQICVAWSPKCVDISLLTH